MRSVIKLLLLSCLLSSCLKSDDDITAQEQFFNELKIIDDHLASQSITPIVDISGVRMVIETLGKGLPPKQTSRVKVNYVGKFLDGSVFDEGTLDQNFEKNIYGWKVAMSLMPEGTKAFFYIPSAYGYGTEGSGAIPGNTTLVFYIDLEKVYVTPQEQNQLKADTVEIDTFIDESNIEDVQKDSIGLRYIIKEPGTGNFATWFSKVEVQYTGSVLSEKKLTKFADNQLTSGDSRVINFIDGWKVGLQKLRKGSKATFYIPSGLAYGESSPSSTIPANSILVFDVTLLDIIE